MTDFKLLNLYSLPVFTNIEELSSLCHISKQDIHGIFYRSYGFYKRTTIPKKNGERREIYIPNGKVKAIQAWILVNILNRVNPSHHATAFRKGTNLLANVNPHRFNRFFLCLDIEDFFPSIDRKRVSFLFNDIGYSKETARLLSRLCTCGTKLPQGGVTSPAISNLVVNRLDRRISKYCSNHNIVYTRYADDITISSNNRSILNNSIDLVKEIVSDEGFNVNESKTHFLGPRKKCVITGLVKNSSEPLFGIGKLKKNHMRSIAYNLIVNNQAIDSKYSTLDSLNGWLCYLKSVDVSSWEYLNRYIERLKSKS